MTFPKFFVILLLYNVIVLLNSVKINIFIKNLSCHISTIKFSIYISTYVIYLLNIYSPSYKHISKSPFFSNFIDSMYINFLTINFRINPNVSPFSTMSKPKYFFQFYKIRLNMTFLNPL